MNRLTNEQRLQIIEFYYQNACSVKKVHRALLPFYGQFNRPTEASIRAIVKKFRTKFTLLDIKPPTRLRRVRTEENIAAVSASVGDDRELSIRRRSQQLGLCYSTTWKILRKDLGDIQLVQEPSGDENRPEDDDNNEEGVSDMGTGGSTDSSVTDDASDSEDNQPLTSYVPKQKPGRKSGTKCRLSDDSFVADEEKLRNGRRKRDTGGVGCRISSRRNQRGSRNPKRPRYYELSDDDEYVTASNSRGKKQRTVSASVVGSSALHQEDLEASTMDSDDDQLVSVSSRGRVRKITAKARGIFKE